MAMAKTIRCDVAVVGAGIAGSSAAFHLASQGVATVLVEKEHPAAGPTGKSSAICHLFYTMPELSLLARRGCEILMSLKELTGVDGLFHRTGVLWACGEKSRAEWQAAVR